MDCGMFAVDLVLIDTSIVEVPVDIPVFFECRVLVVDESTEA